jgi:hypothetical protein|tara:strand:+ start:427 stop:681 length:255 start_codon:yes stop_codon:yes gene_type:complete
MNDVPEHLLDNATAALLDLVNATVRVIREYEGETGYPVVPSVPTSEAIEKMRAASSLVVAAFGLVATEDGAEEPEMDGNSHLRN